MNIQEAGIYHIYNRGNNQQTIFFNEDNYIYFLYKCRKYLKPVSNVLAWCLMKNHFHFLIELTDKSLERIPSGGITMPAITNGFRLLQSSYTKGINIQEEKTGNLFQQKTKAKLVSGDTDYSFTAFNYIHQNPVVADIVSAPEDWPYSSFSDYLGLRNGNLCNKERAISLLNLTAVDLRMATSSIIEGKVVERIFK